MRVGTRRRVFVSWPGVRVSWREIEHTADWAIEVRAPNLEALYLEAAAGLYGLAGCTLGDGDAEETFEVDGPDDETVLVAFLEELLYFIDVHHLAFDSLALTRDGEVLRVRATGGREVTAIVKTIKAVTYHDLEIERDEATGELVVTVVVDV